MSNYKELNDEDLKKVTGGTFQYFSGVKPFSAGYYKSESGVVYYYLESNRTGNEKSQVGVIRYSLWSDGKLHRSSDTTSKITLGQLSEFTKVDDNNVPPISLG